MTMPLSIAAITSYLSKSIHIEILDSIDSTNNYLLEQKQHTEAVCLAEHQTNGKGQLGREWHSPHGENIYLSYRCHLPKPMGEIGSLSVQVAKLVCGALNQFGIKEGLTVKWPNDVIYNSKKLAGILIEVQPGEDNTSHVVIGIGLNVNMLFDDKKNISQPWTSMQAIMGRPYDRNQVAATIINSLVMQIRELVV